MTETAVRFGAGGRLFGLLTPPVADVGRPCLVVLNAGLVYRAGPGRLSVELARRAAAAGFPAFRFDLSGMGDSEPRVPLLQAIPSAVADTREAMDHLGLAHGFTRFVIAGLCSGAINAHHAAVADERVVGAVLLDGYVFPTLRSRLSRATARLRSPRGLLRRLGRLLRQGGRGGARALPEDERFLPKWPRRSVAARELERLGERRVNLLFLYSGEWSRWYRYDGQMRDALGRLELGGHLSERQVPEAEHLYFTRPEREAMLASLIAWLEDRFPSGITAR